MRWLFVLALIGLYSGGIQAKIKPYSSNVKRWATSLVVAGVVSTGLFYNSAIAQQDPAPDQPPPQDQPVPQDIPPAEAEVDWRKIDNRSLAQHRSVFYLLIDMFDNWRVMPLAYLGNDRGGDPLFIGARMQIIRRGRKLFKFGIPSLVSYQGLVSENVDVQEVATFIHPDDRYFDFTILKVNDVDLDDYQAIAITSYPSNAGQELEMVAYRLDLAQDLLHFFSYPSYVRDCQSDVHLTDKVDRRIVLHNCNVFHTPAVRGTPIFTAGEDGELVALHFGDYRDGLSYAVEIPQQVGRFLSLPVEARGKMTLTWGEVKQLAIEGR